MLLVALLFVTFIAASLAASAETALTSISRIKLRRLVEDGNQRAAVIEKLHREPNEYLTAILTTNTMAIVISATSASLIAENHGLTAFLPQLLVSFLDAMVVLVFAEITAKSLALSNIGFALMVAPTIATITTVLRPGLRLMSGFARLVARGRGTVKGPFVTEEELKMLVTVGEEEGIIEEEEREMIHGIIEIGDMTVREAMIPRIDIVAVEVTRPIAEIVGLILKHGHTRIPVYEQTIDHIVGVAYAKDLLRYSSQRRGESGKNGDLRKVLRKPYFVPENKNLSEFLHEMRENRVHMAIVIDEHGQTAGMITIEDIIEEIVGPIQDEYDVGEEDEIQFISPNEVVLDGRVSVDDVNDLLKLHIAGEDYDSIGGYVLNQLGAMPRVGDRLPIGDAELKVEAVQGTRIKKVRIHSETPFQVPQVDDGQPTLSSSPQRANAQEPPPRP